MRLSSEAAQFWGTAETERQASYPCDAYAHKPYRRYLRAVDVDADAAMTFCWVCQLKVAPYSYDWIDHLGRRSPRTLTPGMDQLAVGQRFMIGRIVDFEPGRHITAVSTPKATQLFGSIALTYQVDPRGAHSRLVVAMTVTASSAAGRLRRELLGWGDLVMMRKQLLTLKRLAEAEQVLKGEAR